MILEQYQELRQNEYRNHAELIRLQTAKLVNMSGRSLKDGEMVTPEELWQYDWDKTCTDVNEFNELNDEQIAAHNARLTSML